LAAEHVSITEPGKRTMGTIMLDTVFGRTPKIRMPAAKVEEYDLVVFVGPVWMGNVASPFRACFRELGAKIGKYAFVSISGGADGPNPKLAAELAKRLGKNQSRCLTCTSPTYCRRNRSRPARSPWLIESARKK